MSTTLEDTTNFKKNRIKDLKEIYSDSTSAKNNYNKSAGFSAQTYSSAAEVRKALSDAANGDKSTLIETSRKLYAVNPIYSRLVDYFSNLFMWRYVVIPHQLSYKKAAKENKFRELYELMLDVVAGLGLEIKIPLILTQLFIEGGSYFTTYCDEESITIDTITFPSKYCRKVGETQFGTGIIQLDFSYFDSLGLTQTQKQQFLESFTPEIQEGYQAYINDMSNNR